MPKQLNPFEFFQGLSTILSGKPNLPESLKGNPTLNVLMKRRSVRQFRDKQIPDDIMYALLEAGRLAPSGVNLQTWAFAVFDEASWKAKFERPIPFHGNRAVIVIGDVSRVRTVIENFPHQPLVEFTLSVINASIAAYAMNVAAESCGVSSVMLSDTGKSGFYDAKYLIEKLGLPEGAWPITTIIFGYAKGAYPAMPPKLPLNEITFTDTYKTADPNVMKKYIQAMMAGYRAMNLTHGFNDQLRDYTRKADGAEQGLIDTIFYKTEPRKKSLSVKKAGSKKSAAGARRAKTSPDKRKHK